MNRLGFCKIPLKREAKVKATGRNRFSDLSHWLIEKARCMFIVQTWSTGSVKPHAVFALLCSGPFFLQNYAETASWSRLRNNLIFSLSSLGSFVLFLLFLFHTLSLSLSFRPFFFPFTVSLSLRIFWDITLPTSTLIPSLGIDEDLFWIAFCDTQSTFDLGPLRPSLPVESFYSSYCHRCRYLR